MKKIISLITALCIILGSFSFAFASATSWDTTDQANLQSIKSALTSSGTNTLYSIISRLAGYCVSSNKGVAAWADDIENHLASTLYLEDGGVRRSITWWIKEAVLDLDAIKNSITGVASGSIGYYLQNILGMLSYSDNGTLKSWLADMWQVNSAYLPLLSDIKTLQTTFNNFFLTNTNRSYGGWVAFNGDNISSLYTGTIQPTSGFQALLTGLNYINANTARGLSMLINRGLTGYNSQQSIVSFVDPDSTLTFTPSSGVDGIYKYLNALNTPLARLSYVHASDEEIDAREKAAANTEAVVNNFVDSSGAGSVSVSDIGSLSSAAGSYKSNASTGASATGVWSVFDQSNYNWFSQTTANNLDTSANTRKAAVHYDTPLLDSYYSYMTDYLKENPDD